MDKRTNSVRAVWRWSTVGLLLLLWASVSEGQTTSITSSGLNTQVSHVGGQQNYDITGGTRPGNGTNLFHSFGDFSVGTSDVARFLNDSGLATTNILSRVTGGHVSNIYGQINTMSFPGANLYLINPAGVLFGPTATLNVSGSVHVSTADYLRLADGLRFNAIPGPQDTLLSEAPVAAFGFLHAHTRPITVQGSQLSVAEGKSLSLVGGNIRMTRGTLNASGGEINLVSLAGRGEARVTPEGIAITGRTHGGHIMIKGGTQTVDVARLDTSGAEGGAVVIRGGRLSLTRTEVTTGAKETNHTGGDIMIEGMSSARFDSVDLSTGILSPPPGVSSGSGGAVSLTAPSVRASNLAVDTSAFNGPGGNVSIRATGDVVFRNSGISTGNSFGGGLGDSGDITVQAAKLTLTESSIISQTGVGRIGNIDIDVGRLTMQESSITAIGFEPRVHGGDIRVSARDAIVIDGLGIGTETIGRTEGGSITLSTPHLTLDHSGGIQTHTLEARAGDISVNVRTLTMRKGGHIISRSGGFVGSGGNIDIVASRSISMAGIGDDGPRRIPTAIDSSAIGAGSAGRVHIVTPTMRLDDRAEVRTLGSNAGSILLDVGRLALLRGARIESTKSIFGPGTAGAIVINAAKDIILDQGTISAARAGNEQGDRAGNVDLQAGGSIQIRNGSRISADNTGVGDAGHIVVQAGRSFISRKSTVSALAEQGNGGTMVVDAKSVVLRSSQLTTSVSGGPDTVGGRIVVDAKNMTLGNSQILSTATEGDGGTIHIRSRAFHKDAKSVIDASSESGTDGTVTIEKRH